MTNSSCAIVLAENTESTRFQHTRAVLRRTLVPPANRKTIFKKWGLRLARALAISLTIGIVAELLIEGGTWVYNSLEAASESDVTELAESISDADPELLSELLLNPENFDAIASHPEVITELLSVPEVFAVVAEDPEALAEILAEPEVFSRVAAEEEIFSALVSHEKVIAELATEAATFNELMVQPEVIAYLSQHPESALAILSNDAAVTALAEQPYNIVRLRDCLEVASLA